MPDHDPVALDCETLDLLRNYDRPGPRYTSYPTAVQFTSEFEESDYRERLSAADERPDVPWSLYLHLPFCRHRCWFCGCNVVVSPGRAPIESYLRDLERELDLVAARLPRRRKVSQYHWGGGTPTYLSEAEITALHRGVTRRFEIEPDAEAAIEIDPRETDRSKLALLRRLGFNRISMGVQDFNPEVQRAIGREQTADQTRAAYETCRALGFDSVNVDLIYGLPGQTESRFVRSTAALTALRPDRIALYSYAHVPWLMAHQKRIDSSILPSAETKLRLFCIARERLIEAGYVPIGMDHFALPGDELVQALGQSRLGRNFMGYTVVRGTDSIGLGVSAIGSIGGCYAQNTKNLTRYRAALDAGRLPIERGCIPDRDDRIRREVILGLMCNFRVDTASLSRRFRIDFSQYFAAELTRLRAPGGPVEHGLLEIYRDRLEVPARGRLVVRNLCMEFDRHLSRATEPSKPVFSRTI